MPDERDGRPGRHGQIELVQHVRPLAIAEANPLEGHPALDVGQRLRAGPVENLRLFLHDVHDLVERRRC